MSVIVYNIDSTTLYLPTYDVTVAPGESAKVSKGDADSMVAGGLWSLSKPGNDGAPAPEKTNGGEK